MKKLIISGALCAVVALGGAGIVSAEETTTTAASSHAEKLAKIEQLMKLIAELQEKLKAAKGEAKELMSDLREGAEGDDVRKVQELLATDPNLFGVKPTGFFGPKTKEALMKFQERYGLEVTGVLDEPTREAIKELREDGVTPGLLKSEAVKDRIKARLQEKWGDCDFTKPFRASLCEKGKDKKDHDDDEDEDEDDEDSDEDVTRDDARRALVDAQNELNRFRDSIEEMEDEDATEDEIEEAEDTLAEAKGVMAEARRAFMKNKYEESVEASEEVIDILEGDSGDDSDEDDDDEDEDEDEDDE